MYKEYKVEVIEEGACGTIFLGSARMPVKRLEAKLNEAAAEGWQVVFQVVEQRQNLLVNLVNLRAQARQIIIHHLPP